MSVRNSRIPSQSRKKSANSARHALSLQQRQHTDGNDKSDEDRPLDGMLRQLSIAQNRPKPSQIPPPRQYNQRVSSTTTAKQCDSLQTKRIGTKGFSKGKTPKEKPKQKEEKPRPFTRNQRMLATRKPPQASRNDRTSTSNRPKPKFTQAKSRGYNKDDTVTAREDELFPKPFADQEKSSSAFPTRFSLLSVQKHVPKHGNREVVIDTIYNTLFAKKSRSTNGKLSPSSAGRKSSRQQVLAVLDDSEQTGTDTDQESTEASIRQSLVQWLLPHIFDTSDVNKPNAIEHFISERLVQTLVTALRFEDYRLASPRLDILRAIHKHCNVNLRRHIAIALAESSALRLQYVQATNANKFVFELESCAMSEPRSKEYPSDHGHGMLELLRYMIEHGIETHSTEQLDKSPEQRLTVVARNCIRTFLNLWKTHWMDPTGTDEAELLTCASQFVAHVPAATNLLLSQLLHRWPTQFPSMQVVAIQMLARLMMTSAQSLSSMNVVDSTHRDLVFQLFARVAECMKSMHVETALEALAFSKSQFVLYRFVSTRRDVYKLLSESLHHNAKRHWNSKIRLESEQQFDQILDFATFV
uniref:Uncharacterized protein AlNc14C29G2750 n=1 Tax=Albugo laibachii Nc14 TaxID=890382 RepID=F0W7D5_9STRA|nr:conserved hypothetical protein [Albugo laibachii Nc14]|eukprot:CCA17034.1 conserved hypothetical protein [Albugo laibachii Nc14]